MELVEKDMVFKAWADYFRWKHILKRVAAVLLPLTGEVLAHAPPDLTWVLVRAFGTSLLLARGQIKA